MPASIPWKTRPNMGAQRPDQPPDPGPPDDGTITTQPPQQAAFDWALEMVTYDTPVIGNGEFGHADGTAAPITQLVIPGNPGASMRGGVPALLFVTVDRFEMPTVTDPLDTWNQLEYSAANGVLLVTYEAPAVSPHAETDAITLDFGSAVSALAGVYWLDGAPGRIGQSAHNGSGADVWSIPEPAPSSPVSVSIAGTDPQPYDQWSIPEPDMSAGGELVIGVSSASCVYRPNGPHLWYYVGSQDGTGADTGHGLSYAVYRGSYAPAGDASSRRYAALGYHPSRDHRIGVGRPLRGKH